MKRADTALAVLAISLLSCGARTALEFGDEGGPGGTGGLGGHAGVGGRTGFGGTSGFGGGSGGSAGGAAGSSAAGAGLGGSAGSVSCLPTGPEVCDGMDNDCNGVVDDGNVCPCDARAFGNRTYLFCSAVAAWRTAQMFCESHGYQLASIQDASEDHWLEQTVFEHANARWWIGLNDIAQEGHFTWQGGAPLGYVHWGAGEPNDTGGNEDCGELNRFGVDGGWNDEPCDEALPFVCESHAR